jgi:hypothetical protein
VAVADSLMWYDVSKDRLQVGDHVTVLLDCHHSVSCVLQRHPETGRLGCWAPERCPSCETQEISDDDL